MSVVQLVSWRSRLLTNLSFHFLTWICRLDYFKDRVVYVSTWWLLLHLKLSLLRDLSLSNCWLTRLYASLHHSLLAIVSLLLLPLWLIMDHVLPLRLALVSVDEASKLIHLFGLSVILLKTALLRHSGWGGSADPRRDLISWDRGIRGRTVVHDVTVVVLMNLLGLYDRNLLPRIRNAWSFPLGASSSNLALALWRRLHMVHLNLRVIYSASRLNWVITSSHESDLAIITR